MKTVAGSRVVPAMVWSVSQGWVWGEMRPVRMRPSVSAGSSAALRRGWLVVASPAALIPPVAGGGWSQYRSRWKG